MSQPQREYSRRAMWRLGRTSDRKDGKRLGWLGRSGALGDLVKIGRPGMGSIFEIRLPASTPGAVDLAYRGLDLIDRLEEQLSVYRDDSELSRINALAHAQAVPVEPGLFRLLETAFELSEATAGAYDVTAGALSEAWGFVRGSKRVPDPQTLAQARACSGYRHVTLDPESQTVRFDVEGLKLNLGSIGKGYALDRVRELIEAHWWPTGALIHGGRSSAIAIGSPPGTIAGRWRVALRNPFRPERPLGEFRLRNRALGTSGAAFQAFEEAGRSYGHIIDPRTGEPPRGPASVSVLAPSAALADALSTAFYLLGTDFARDYLATRTNLGAVFVLGTDNHDHPQIVTLGVAQGDFFPEAGALE